MVAFTGCGKQATLPFGHPANAAAYVDLEKVVAAHPLHTELDSLQNQITLLSGQLQNAPQPQTAAQAQAQTQMENELAAADQQFQAEITSRRTYYEQREAAAIAALQSQAAGGNAPIGAQFGQEAQKIQTDALKAYGDYQKQLFAADSAHLQEVSRQLQQELALKLGVRRTQFEKQETEYQINLAKQSQTQRLNLKTKLEDLTLTQEERAQYTSQLQNIETRDEALINQLKARDEADLRAYQSQLQRDAATRYNEARVAAMTQTQAKLQARQKDTNDQLRTQLSGIGNQYQRQVASANQTIQNNPRLRAQVDKIHNENQSQYSAEFQKAYAAYQQTRKSLVDKYSAVAHMQFQDNMELQSEAQQLAAQRRTLYGKIVDQVQTQIGEIARKSGVSVVFTSVRGAGAATDLTDEVTKAIAALPASAPSPSSSKGL